MHSYYYRFAALVLTLGVAACASPGNGAPALVNGASTRTALSPMHKGYKVVYNFPGYANGDTPMGGLVSLKGVMYGTAIFGGDFNACGGCGVVFAGKKAIYSFKGLSKKDGAKPNGDLLVVGNELYGTTGAGGVNPSGCGGNPDGAGCGTVFKIDGSGKEQVVYRFTGDSDGVDPRGGLVSLNGVLYGTTRYGGASCGGSTRPGGCGIVFSIDGSGKEKVVYEFTGAPDGAYPLAALLSEGSDLYGTTQQGGKCHFSNGCGTVFKITASGKESVVYSFQGNQDGEHPESPLISVNGSIYGSTNEGGCSGTCYSNTGYGTLFELSASAKEQVLHSFSSTPDGAYPSGRLVFEKNKLYGTTLGGGAKGHGSIFSSGAQGLQILYSFASTPDGAIPSGLAARGSTTNLYGTTQAGGTQGSSGGLGTIFRYAP